MKNLIYIIIIIILGIAAYNYFISSGRLERAGESLTAPNEGSNSRIDGMSGLGAAEAMNELP